jgi:hypothetical protein
MQGRRIPPPFQGVLIDSESQGVALGWNAAAPAPAPCSSARTLLELLFLDNDQPF